MTQAIRIRPLRNEDTDEVVALYGRASAVDQGLGPVPRPAWQRFVQLPQNRDGRDFRVAERDGRFVGLAEYSLRDQGERKARFFKIVVDPAMRRRGVATALMRELLAIDEPSDKLSLQSLCSPDWSAGMRFLEALGFSHIESEISMRCSCLLQPASEASSETFIERAAAPARYATDVARIHNAAFRSDVAFRRYSPTEMQDVLRDGELWLATDDGHVLGFCLLEPGAGAVWVESIAIDPACQGRGLGQLLAHRALEAAGIAPEHPVELNVSSVNQPALKLYARLGFAARRERFRYSAPHSRLAAMFAQRLSPGDRHRS